MSASSTVGQIAYCRIHPGIGVARVGNSPSTPFTGPEVPGVPPSPRGGFTDSAGRLRKQAAQFRIYGYSRDGRVVREVTAEDAEICWSVHVANAKAAWYRFDRPFDLPLAVVPGGLVSIRRNSGLTGTDRRQLVIDPGRASIRGERRAGPVRLDGGTFRGEPVSLGELRCDAAGRLLVIGSSGRCDAPRHGGALLAFGNNDGWFDDTCDGPVEATVHITGQPTPVTPAWVIVAPPNFCPGLYGVVTAYDLAFDAYAREHPGIVAPRPSFGRHIGPLLRRVGDLQWVNVGSLAQFGPGSCQDFADTAALTRLACPDRSAKPLRYDVFRRFRQPALTELEPAALPPIYGDGIDIPPSNAHQFLSVTPVQYRWLEQWAAGDFTPDLAAMERRPTGLVGIPAGDQPAALDEAALEACLGGPFHPGYEVPWVLRVPTIYAGLCRLRLRPADTPEPDYGPELRAATVFAADGPLASTGPGGLTRWLSVPWPADVPACRFGYRRRSDPPLRDPFLPTFWPTRVPNHILTAAGYREVLAAPDGSDAQRAAFLDRRDWLRGLSGVDRNELVAMHDAVRRWSELRPVTPRAGAGPGSGLPTTFHVED